VRTTLLRCHECRYQVSVTAGTIFQDTRISLRLWPDPTLVFSLFGNANHVVVPISEGFGNQRATT